MPDYKELCFLLICTTPVSIYIGYTGMAAKGSFSVKLHIPQHEIVNGSYSKHLYVIYFGAGCSYEAVEFDL